MNSSVSIPATARSDIQGPIDGDDYTWRDAFDLVSTVNSPCGVDSILNIRSDIRVSNSGNKNGSGYLATDSVRPLVSYQLIGTKQLYSRLTLRSTRYVLLHL